MRATLPVLTFLTVAAAGTVAGQITINPLPTPIPRRGLSIQIQDYARLPDSRDIRPKSEDVAQSGYARVSFVKDLPDGRRFVNDSRGVMYLVDASRQPQVYWEFHKENPFGVYNRLESGFISFEFHPEFAKNGLIYTVHSERAPGNPAKPNFIPPGFAPEEVTYHNVITEWRATNPASNTFAGTRRELLRVAHIVDSLTHPMGFAGFNPTAKPGSADYGLIYTSGSDLGFSNGQGSKARNPTTTQRLDSVVGAILRIDPRSPSASGGMKGLGDYTIPASNTFAADGDPKTLGEIYAYGFRNAHRLSWDPMDGTMYATDIGMSHIEEVNIVRNGGNYGWMKREGYWENGIVRGGALNELFPLPAEVLDGRRKDEFIYPVAIYDHDEGIAIAAGFPYYGRIEALKGKFVFGDIARGRLFAADIAAVKKADDGIPQTVAPVEEIQLYTRDDANNREFVTLRQLIEATLGAPVTRADLHLSISRDGELFVTSRQDGTIRLLVPDGEGLYRGN
jgi:hypothetical protein